tara:strand:+ start:56 stop:601 length:546 start_codon:yes stop_codon:yes gene_type:complete
MISIPYDISLLQEMLKTPDDIGAVLRGHLIIERCLVDKCAQFFPDVEKVYGDRLDTAHCLRLLRLISAPDSLLNPCGKINSLRNKFAHGKLNELTAQHVQELRSLLPDKMKGFVDSNSIKVSDGNGNEVSPATRNLPRIQLSIIVSLLQMQILAANGTFSVEFGPNQSAPKLTWKSIDFDW